jgi:hypothetical protein
MLTDRARKILLGAIPLFFLHGLEEGATGILALDPFFRRFGQYAAYALAVELALIAAVLYAAAKGWGGKGWARALHIGSGILLLIEVQHVYGAVSRGGYYPGLYTAAAIVSLGARYWRDLLGNMRTRTP